MITTNSLVPIIVAIITLAECAKIEELWIIPKTEVESQHNKYRAMHEDTQPLRASLALSLDARSCIEKMIVKEWDVSTHPCKPGNQQQGENIYVGTSGANSKIARGLTLAVQGWYAEWKDINYGTDYWSYKIKPILTGHVTQMLWSSTKEVGCAGGTYTVGGNRKTIVDCRYSPSGNLFYSVPLKENIGSKIGGNQIDCVDQIASLCATYATDPDKYCNGPLAATGKAVCKKTCGTC